MRALVAVLAVGIIALPVFAQRRDAQDSNNATLDALADLKAASDAANAAADAANAANAAADAADNYGEDTTASNTVSDTTYDAYIDGRMDTNMSMDAAGDIPPPPYRFYRVATVGSGQRASTYYMDNNSVRRTSLYVRAWETEHYNYQPENTPPGSRVVKALVEANCREQQIRYLTSTYYNRAGTPLRTLESAYPRWIYVAPDTVGASLYQFLCDDNRAYHGTYDTDLDALVFLPRERPAMDVPRFLRPRPNPPRSPR